MYRHIDTDKVMLMRFNNDVLFNAKERKNIYRYRYMQGWNDAIDEIIGNVLTADVVLVKRGKWIEDDDSTVRGHCSACGWESHYYEDDVVGMDYCPNCGAYMMSEVEQDEVD